MVSRLRIPILKMSEAFECAEENNRLIPVNLIVKVAPFRSKMFFPSLNREQERLKNIKNQLKTTYKTNQQKPIIKFRNERATPLY